MKSEVIEFSMNTGWEWFIQIFSLILLIGVLASVVIIGILIFKAIKALNIYIKNNK